jgi:hypothetical protein
MSIDKTDPLHPFGEAQWREFAETVRASDLQLKFAVARFNGASAAESARIDAAPGGFAVLTWINAKTSLRCN